MASTSSKYAYQVPLTLQVDMVPSGKAAGGHRVV